jgi:phage terminase large subunit-like protein
MLVTIAANPYQVNSTDLIALKGAGKRNAGNNALAQIKSGGKQSNSNTSATSTNARDLASVGASSINVFNYTKTRTNQHRDQKSFSDSGVIASVESESINVFSNTQQQAHQHLDKKRVAITTDTATPKITLSPGQESPKNLQQQSISPTKAKISSERKQHYKDKQSLAAITTFEAQQLVPVFRVKANDQIFSGYNSVTLNNRMLRIDGKAVAQAKMVVVVGQPQSIQADGKVSHTGNSAVLISR